MKELSIRALFILSLFTLCGCITSKETNTESTVTGKWTCNIPENTSHPSVEFKADGTFEASFIEGENSTRWKKEQIDGQTFYRLYDIRENPGNSKHMAWMHTSENGIEILTVYIHAHSEVTFLRDERN